MKLKDGLMRQGSINSKNKLLNCSGINNSNYRYIINNI